MTTEPGSRDEHKANLRALTDSERRTYQSLVARGTNPADALEGALDGIDVHDVREAARKKAPKSGRTSPGPEVKGTLRRNWRYELLGVIADENGDYNSDVWNKLSERVARMVKEAQAEAWEIGVEAAEQAERELRSSEFHVSSCDCGRLPDNPYEDEE